MLTGFSIKSCCIENPDNNYRIHGKKIFNMHPYWFILGLFVPQIMNLFSIPFTDRQVTKFYMNMFRKNVEYRLTHHIIKHDILNLLIQLMEKGYIESEDDKKANDEACKYIYFTFILIAFICFVSMCV